MKPWTSIKLILFIVSLVMVAMICLKNLGILQGEFMLFGEVTMPMWFILLGAFVIGLLLSVITMGMHQVEMYIEGFKVKKLNKKLSLMDDLYQRGVGALLDGKSDFARASFDKMLESEPDNALALLRLGTLERTSGHPDKALTLHSQAHESRPELFETFIEMAKDHMALKDWSKAAQVLKEGLRHDDDPTLEGRALLLDAHTEAGEWKKAEDLYDDLKKISTPEILPCLKELRCIIPYRKAALLSENDESKSAEKILRKILQKSPEFIPAYMALGALLADRDKNDDAAEIWCNGYRTTGSPAFLTRLEDFYIALEKPDRAVEVFRTMMEARDNEILPRFLLGKLYLRLEMVDEALEQFRALDARLVKSPTLHYFLAKVQERRQLFREAVESYKKAVRDSGALKLQFCCHHCHACYESWVDRCSACGRWNAIDIDLSSELSPTDLTLVSAPVYSPKGESAEAG